MKLTDEQINKIMTKEIAAKTVLVSVSDSDEIISKHLNDGWTLVNKVQLNNKYKITFKK